MCNNYYLTMFFNLSQGCNYCLIYEFTIKIIFWLIY